MKTKKIVKKSVKKEVKPEIWGPKANKRLAELKKLALKNKSVGIYIQSENDDIMEGTLMIRNINPSKFLYIIMKEMHKANPKIVKDALLEFFAHK